ncbi:MAG: linear amide C-N hydrolase [Clostridia bacterium]|nr:linear amide C-N hydrolase [Clostridia bacterium]
MKSRKLLFAAAVLLAALTVILSACKKEPAPVTATPASAIPTEMLTETLPVTTTAPATTETTTVTTTAAPVNAVKVNATQSIVTLEKGLKIAKYQGDAGFSSFLSGGGAASDSALTDFLVKYVLKNNPEVIFKILSGGCSTVYSDGLFGRNFDWHTCEAMILVTSGSGYKSVSTVNLDFVNSSTDYDLTDDIIRLSSVYAPLDGMNEKGVCISVNMIPDGGATIGQSTGKTDLTTSTAVRLVLNKASSAKHAVELLKNYDLHSSYGYLVHFAICDPSGCSVAVEYINNKMYVTETRVLTNFYVAKERFGVGSKESKARYDTLNKALDAGEIKDAATMRDTLAGVKADGSGTFSSTEWTAVYDMKNLTVTYYHRGNYKKGYTVSL